MKEGVYKIQLPVRLSVWDDEKILGLGSADGSTVMGMYLMPLELYT